MMHAPESTYSFPSRAPRGGRVAAILAFFVALTLIDVLVSSARANPAFSDWPSRAVRIVVPFPAGSANVMAARMYAEGDGVRRDDHEAFKFFTEIVEQDVEPGSPEESYVSDALVALGGYLRRGIPGAVKPDPAAAQEYYMRAAATYRNADAQYEMGNMFLKGEGGVKASVRQAGRWFQLAAEKGHAGAQATLGNLLFQSGRVVRGLAMMTAALERASPADQPWIRGMQEEAFSLAGEADRRTAIALAQDILGKGSNSQ